jgi:hypothetical protein
MQPGLSPNTAMIHPGILLNRIVGHGVLRRPCLSATGFDNSAASRTEPPTVRFEAIRDRIVPLILHLSAKSLHIGSTSTLLFGSAQVALCAASLGKSNRR